MAEVYEVLKGIREEIEDTPEFFEFQIEEQVQDGQLWKIYVDLTQMLRSEGLDESLESAAAWWAGPPKGGADVLSVVPETQQINLRFVTAPPPGKGGRIRLYPPLYLEALLSCWENNEWANRCRAWLASSDQPTLVNKGLDTKSFPWLRPRQAAAFHLVSRQAGFLWGPPGTGKTTTLGAMLAQYMIEFPKARALLLSTTNSAVDLALLAVDEALKGLRQSSAAATVRRNCFRVGNHFIASNYKGKEHLLPVKDENLVRQLADLEARRPDKENVQAYASWKQQVEMVRLQIRRQASRVLKQARLAAMTTTRAVFTFGDLYELYPYDLIVFDEASQVGLAHALALAPLARSVLFAGDPKQLSPIVRSTHPLAERWLGESMFFYMQEATDSTCLLNEQSRMAEPICDLVSNLFYKGKLMVAEECRHDPRWTKARVPPPLPPLESKNVCLQTIAENGTWSKKYHGPIRHSSAVLIQELVVKLAKHVDPADILVLTPFRAQRALLRIFLRKAGCSRVTVSTVHRAQGSERHTVIFDPAQGDSQFLQDKNASRLINVALSRAKARLVIILSPGDRRNPLFDQIANLIENADALREAVSISQFVFQPTFPDCTLERVVQIGTVIGRVVEIDKQQGKLTLIDIHTGQRRKYVTSGLIKVVLKDKAQKIQTDPKANYWTTTERPLVRKLVGNTPPPFFSDEKLAQLVLELN